MALKTFGAMPCPRPIKAHNLQLHFWFNDERESKYEAQADKEDPQYP